jgi:hypothetical protein
VHDAGADACGPNTLKVIVPLTSKLPPDSVAVTDDASIVFPEFPVAGAVRASDVVNLNPVTVSLPIAAPQAELEASFFASPPYVAYHQKVPIVLGVNAELG